MAVERGGMVVLTKGVGDLGRGDAGGINVKSLGTATPISRPITTPVAFGFDLWGRVVMLAAVGKWLAGATAKSLA